MNMDNLIVILVILIFFGVALKSISFLSERSSFFKGELDAINKLIDRKYKGGLDNFSLIFQVLFFYGPGLFYLVGLVFSPLIFILEDKSFNQQSIDFIFIWAYFFIQFFLTPFTMRIAKRFNKSYKLLWDDYEKSKSDNGLFKSIPQIIYGFIGIFWINFLILLPLLVIVNIYLE